MPKLRHFQEVGVKWLKSMPAALLGDEMGCISGSASIKMYRNLITRPIRLDTLYACLNGLTISFENRHGTKTTRQSGWDLSTPTFCKSLGPDGILRANRILRVLKKGNKEVVRVTLRSGKSITLTPDHQVLTKDMEWRECGSLNAGSRIMTNGTLSCNICGSIDRVSTYAYAKFPGVCRKCMYRKLRHNHTFKTGKFVDKDGYVRVSAQYEHPRANNNGAVYEHVLVMESHIGRYISTDEHVHHKNGIKSDNRIENLEILTSAQHLKAHDAFLHMDGGRAGTGGTIIFKPREDEIVSIVPCGFDDVYDIVMDEPSRNFVADGIIVHNCGKTPQAVCAVEWPAPVVVACPATIKGNWKKEFNVWRPEYKVSILKGRNSFVAPMPGQVIITNYEILDDKPIGVQPATHVILDEATAVKSNDTQKHKRSRVLAKQVFKQRGKVWLLTGTPLMNHPYELWNILRVAKLEGQVFKNFFHFLDMFNAYQGRFGIVYGAPDPRVKDLLKRVMLRRLRSEVLPELPKKSFRDVSVEIPQNVRDVCNEALMCLKSHGIDLEGSLDMVDETALGGAEFDEVSRARKALAIAKIPHMLKLIEGYEDEDEPLVVFSCHRAPIDLLASRPGWAVITGDTPHGKRTLNVDDFQAGKLKGIASTVQAGGIGITLTRSHNALFVDESWVPAVNSQARDRLDRFGQTRGVVITRLVADHAIDERVMEVCDSKISLTDEVLGREPVLLPLTEFEPC